MSPVPEFLQMVHPATWTGAVIDGVLLLLFGVVASILIRVVARRAMRRHAIDPMAVQILGPVLQIAVWLAIGVIYAHLVPELQALGTAMLTGVSVLSIVLGVAAQSTLGNAIAGLALLIYRPFRVGDHLMIMAPTGSERGRVESVSLGYTTLLTHDNRRLVVPNSQAGSMITVNMSTVDQRMLTSLDLRIGHGSDLSQVQAMLTQIAMEDPDVEDVEDCPVIDIHDAGATLRVLAWCPDAEAAHRFSLRLYGKAWEKLDVLGIERPCPTHSIRLVAAD